MNIRTIFFRELEAKVSKDENADPKFDSSLLQLLLEEIRNLRVQLQKSIDANMALKEKVEEQLGLSLNTSGTYIYLYNICIICVQNLLHILFPFSYTLCCKICLVL